MSIHYAWETSHGPKRVDGGKEGWRVEELPVLKVVNRSDIMVDRPNTRLPQCSSPQDGRPLIWRTNPGRK